MECINRDYSTKGNNYIVAMTYYERLFNKDDNTTNEHDQNVFSVLESLYK